MRKNQRYVQKHRVSRVPRMTLHPAPPPRAFPALTFLLTPHLKTLPLQALAPPTRISQVLQADQLHATLP